MLGTQVSHQEHPRWTWIGRVAGYQYSLSLGFCPSRGFVLDGQAKASTAALHLRVVLPLLRAIFILPHILPYPSTEPPVLSVANTASLTKDSSPHPAFVSHVQPSSFLTGFFRPPSLIKLCLPRLLSNLSS